MNSAFLAAQAGQKSFKNREKGNPHKPDTLERWQGLLPMAKVKKGEGFHTGHRSLGCILGNSWSQAPWLHSARTESFLYLNKEYIKRKCFGTQTQDTEGSSYTTHI